MSTLIEHPDVEQRSPEWFQLRNGTVTASVVGKLVTPTLKVADNDTSRTTTRTLVAERITGWSESSPMTSDMWRGVEMEPYARDHYSGLYEQAVEYGYMERQGDGWSLGLSPDGVIRDEGLLEVKCPRAQTHVRTILDDQVPANYIPQLQAALLVSGRDWIDFVSYVSGMPLYCKRVYPDPKWHAAIEAACRAFEDNAIALVADYRARVAGLPTTERIDPYPEIEIPA